MTREILGQIYKALDDKKGIDIRMIDIGKISSMADYFVIASANNDNQIQAMVSKKICKKLMLFQRALRDKSVQIGF